jgi:selenide,water dikinase
VDFFTPIVDDAYTFGQIAATNALSDVYAMGGRPLTALALVCFPEKADFAVLERILAGGLAKMMEAACTVIGGHSIRDEETKFGYSVTGLIHPRKVFTNGGARPGDHLLLTKALGTGVISTAIKKGKAKQSWIDTAVASMTTLNKTAAEIIVGDAARPPRVAPAPVEVASPAPLLKTGPDRPAERIVEARDRGATAENQFEVHAMTDITGFGLIGHAREMALASDVSLRLHASRIPLLEGALDCVRANYIPGGLKANHDFAECVVGYEDGIPDEVKTMLFDPQTAGGLLVSVAPENTVELTQALNAAGVPAVEIVEVLSAAKPLITVAT